MNRSALVTATIIGLVPQLAMVIGGHYSPAIKELFAAGGMIFSLIAGIAFAYLAGGHRPPDVRGGAAAGGLCALLAIAVSVILGDVPPSLLLVGTVSSVITGAVGGAIGKLIFG
jgi:hypothetical protein